MADLHVRQRIEEAEENLSHYATRSKLSRGRINPEEPCPLRTAFQRDRDRIIHCNAFRRLKHKTQVFISPQGDHYVTRLTHTLEVSQIARTISRSLNFNEDLTEAIALAHDLGHTPFGHLGEEILNELCQGGFKHNEQSLRVVDFLEKYGQGLNLTWEVRDGILNHSKSYIDILGEGWADVNTVEGQSVKIADIIAYINHDIGDAIRAGVLSENDLPKTVIKHIGNSSSQRINTLVLDIVNHTLRTINNNPENPVVGMSPEILEAANNLREFLFARVYNSDLAAGDKDKAKEVVHILFSYFLDHPSKLPNEYSCPGAGDSIDRKVTDYIAGMTDQYAVRKANEISQNKFLFTRLML
jgi:dGTPase